MGNKGTARGESAGVAVSRVGLGVLEHCAPCLHPSRPVENGYIESFNSKLRDECLNAEVFFSVADAREKLAR